MITSLVVLSTLISAALSADEAKDADDVIAVFQSNGLFDETAFLRFADGSRIGEGLAQFSLCLWLSLNFLRGRKSVFVSYATEASVESLHGAFNYDNLGGKSLTFCTYGAFQPLCVEMRLDDFDFQAFHHVCLVVSVTTRQRKAALYYDGIAKAESM